jgi:hypothetical protein
MYLRPSDTTWILHEQRWGFRWGKTSQSKQKVLIDHPCQILSAAKAATKFQEFNRGLPPELEELVKIRPCWDRDGRQLWYGETLCREYPKEAPNQFKILDAFQAAGWPSAIDSPFLRDPSKLSDTIGDLNERLLKESPFRFRGSTKPEWYPVSSPGNSG